MISHGKAVDGSYLEVAVNSNGTLRQMPTKVFPANDALANLPVNTSAVLVFDLGVDWDQYGWVSIGIQPSTNPTGSIFAAGSDDGSSANGLLVMASNAEFWLASAAAGNTICRLCRPRGRYIRLTVNAGSTGPQGAASRVYVTAYPS